MKKLLATLSLTAVAAFALTACGTKASQGVYDDKIVVGNTAATTGAFAVVGVPFNDGLEAVFKTWNDVAEHKQKLELKHYDDEFDGAKGLDYTKKLVEQDKVFALVGHFGTNTVAATVD
jgi:ABC-type branched-subunit amino acid transport system substrate-binding protein